MSHDDITIGQADAIYDVLVQHAEAREARRYEFIFHLTRGCEEFRFMGSLGFGGKLYVEPGGWRVGAYPEDIKAYSERQQVIDATNAALSQLYAAQGVISR